MSFNLIDLIKNEFSDIIVDQVTSILEEPKENTEKAIKGAIPAILESLVSSSTQPGGAENLVSTLESMDDNLLGNFANMLTGGNHFSLLETGGKLLGSLLGGGSVSKIATTIAGFSGIKSKSATTIIGLLAPVILSVIRNKMSSENLNENGLLDMLQGQQDNIAKAMPAGMQGILGATETAEVPRMETQGGPKIGKYLWLPFLLLIGLFTYFFLPKLLPYEKELETAQPLEGSVGTVSNGIPDYASVGSDLGTAINKIRDTLTSVTDVQSATAAVLQLTETASNLKGLAELYNKLPETAKSSVSSLAANNISMLQPTIDKVVGMPGVGPVLKPVLDRLIETLAVFSAR